MEGACVIVCGLMHGVLIVLPALELNFSMVFQNSQGLLFPIKDYGNRPGEPRGF